MSAASQRGPNGAQRATEALRVWLHEQRAHGAGAVDLLAALCASGWDAELARQALADAGWAVDDALPPAAQAASEGSRAALPELAGAEGSSRLVVDGQPVQVRLAMRRPRLVLLGGLLRGDECEALIEAARNRMAPSQTVELASGGSEVNEARTSRGMFFQRQESALVRGIEQRIAKLVNWPLTWGEGLQVLHYEVGAEYRPHHDFFDPRHAGMAPVLARGGQRLATLVMYLNTPTRGGATVFPDAGVEVPARQGDAVFFSYDRPDASTLTLHAGAPVLEGEKWVATKWLREREFR